MINYYYDAQGIELLIAQETIKIVPYTHNLPATKGTLCPDNALRIAPEFKEGFIPILNKMGDGWDYIEDHRQKKDERDVIIEGTGTSYWLAEDNYQSKAKYMSNLGQLPSGVLLVKPAKTLADFKVEALEKIKQRAKEEEADAYIISSLGFKADASRNAKEDVSGIVQAMANADFMSIPFRDYDNSFHVLSLGDIKILQSEIINKGIWIYKHKWDMQALIEKCTTISQIEAIAW